MRTLWKASVRSKESYCLLSFGSDDALDVSIEIIVGLKETAKSTYG